MAEITSVLFFNVMRYDPKDPRNPAADRFVLSKVSLFFLSTRKTITSLL